MNNSHLTDEQLDATLRAWAQYSINATAAPDYTLPDRERGVDAHTHARRRRLFPALAAATVLILVAAGLAIRSANEHSTPSVSSAPSCPRHDIKGFTTGLPVNHAESLFTEPIAVMTACSYSMPTSTRSGGRSIVAVSLSHRLSVQLAQHLNNSSKSSDDPLQCLVIPSISILMARAEDGAILPPVKLSGGCRQITATNGVAYRYINVDDPVLRQAMELVAKQKASH